jgi:hypothetical protein
LAAAEGQEASSRVSLKTLWVRSGTIITLLKEGRMWLNERNGYQQNKELGWRLTMLYTESDVFPLATCCTLVSFSLDFRSLIFDPVDADFTFHRNVGSHTDYRTLYSRRW